MATDGIEAVFLETHNWGKAVRFFLTLGYEIDFETGHGSGQLRHVAGGPYLFVAEVPDDQPVGTRLVLRVADAEAFAPDPVLDVVSSFQPTHWGTQEMTVRDPDGRIWSLQAPGGAS